MFRRTVLAEGTLLFERGQNRLDGASPWYATYLTADGRYMAVGALEPQFYDLVLSGLGLDPKAVPDREDRANWPCLRAMFAARFLEPSRDAWSEVSSGLDACVSPVLNLREAMGYPHNHARSSAPTADGISHPRPAPHFPSHGEPQIAPPVPAGRDTRAILNALGWSAAEIAACLDTSAAAST